MTSVDAKPQADLSAAIVWEPSAEGDDGFQTLDYRATLHAAADAIEAGAAPLGVATFLHNAVPDDHDIDGLCEAAFALGALNPVGSLGQLCRAMTEVDGLRNFCRAGWDDKSVLDLVAANQVLREKLAAAQPTVDPDLRRFQVAVTIPEVFTYELTYSVDARDDKHAAELVAGMFQRGEIEKPSTPSYSRTDAYSFEVTDSAGPVTSWSEDE